MIVKVKGMHCLSCEKLLSMSIEDSITGAKVASADFRKGTLDIQASEADLPAIRKAIAREGYEVVK